MELFSDLAGKRVVVTGASGVIGRWIVAAFDQAGCHLCLTDHGEADLARVGVALRGESFACPADLTDETSIDALAAEIGRRWAAADVLVNNAGVYPSGFLLDISTAEFDRIFSINFRAPYVLTRELAKQMIANKIRGSIINISSGGSRKMRTTAVPYCTSKAALDRLTKGFGLELAEFGIRVNALEPGFAPGSTVSPLTKAHIEATAGAIPLGRPTGFDDVANGVLYLASAASSYITGATLTIDGGNSIGTMAVYQDKKHQL
jgi:3-oxoacyl-[acyl-carrier protein] reductase